ncbi:putative MFS monocarboxylate transporter [Myriangium duriaei CBS 260.36]|uniref:MFS monocarboxylate transporter n=1 Tax=Myriangium duriaei CBS 260.36 TaxID=1168546 RepID=A0A9P4JAY0_9PEZI|nr:putative MFS monocarboxylate transporter [Myriangium duriaei CBS 260.36]
MTAETARAESVDVDGGRTCWLQVLGAFIVWMNSWGVANKWGVNLYEIEYLPTVSPSRIAWIGSLQPFLLLYVGIISGPLYDAGYFKSLMIVGNGAIVLGLMLTSVCKEYWQLVLAQGILCGIGNGLIFTPGMAVLPQYFVKKRILASGIAATGVGLAGLIYPFIFRRLQPRIGFGWTVRLIGFLVLLCGIICVAVMRTKALPGKMRKVIEAQVFRELAFVSLIAALFFSFLGIYVPFYYIGTYSLAKHINAADMAFYYLPIINAASIIARIGMTFFADRIGTYNLFMPCVGIASILSFAWIGAQSLGSLIVIALIYGACSGIFLSLAIPCVAVLTKDLRMLGQRIGTAAAISSSGVLIGTPICGALVTNRQHYTGLQLFGALVLLIGAGFALTTRVLIAGLRVAKV